MVFDTDWICANDTKRLFAFWNELIRRMTQVVHEQSIQRMNERTMYSDVVVVVRRKPSQYRCTYQAAFNRNSVRGITRKMHLLNKSYSIQHFDKFPPVFWYPLNYSWETPWLRWTLWENKTVFDKHQLRTN